MSWRVSSARSSIRKAPGWGPGWEPARGWVRGCEVGSTEKLNRRAACCRPAVCVRSAIGLVIEPQRHSQGPRLVGQEAYPGACAALTVEREECPLIRQVVGEQPNLPTAPSQSDADIDQRIRRELWLEREERIPQWPADGRLAKFGEPVEIDYAEGTGRQRRRRAADARALVINSGEPGADMLEAPRDRQARSLTHVPSIRQGARQLDLRHAGQAIAGP